MSLVRLVRAPNPSPMTLEGTNTYLVGARNPVVIDPGPDIASHLQAVLEEAGTVSTILLTHRHPDHAEGAARFADMARVRIADEAPGLTNVPTPGHSSDHVSFWLEQERALFSGDHVLGRGTSVIAYPDGDLSDYMASLERVRALNPARLYPGHGPVVQDPAPVLNYYIEHRLERERQVLSALDEGNERVGELVARIYADVDVSLHAAAALSVRAHLRKLHRDGAVTQEGDRWRRS